MGQILVALVCNLSIDPDHFALPCFLIQVPTWCLDAFKMRKHRHLPLVAMFCLFLSGFSLTRAQQQQAGKIQKHFLLLFKGICSLIVDRRPHELEIALRHALKGW